MYHCDLAGTRFQFDTLPRLLAAATPARSGDMLAGLAASSQIERVAARYALADLPLTRFLEDLLAPYEDDEVSRLIIDTHSRDAFLPIAHLTVGGFREWLLANDTTSSQIAAIAPGLIPEMAAAVSKLMRNQELVAVARKARVVTRFRTTQGLEGRLGVRLQPNHPTDDPAGIAASIVDGLLLGCGDAMIGINPVLDNVDAAHRLLDMIERVRIAYSIPTQSCILTHASNIPTLVARGAPVDLAFQSVAGTEAANRAFGIDLALLAEAEDAARSLRRCPPGGQLMYFETGQGAALSAGAHLGIDQQTVEARAYAVARVFDPFLVNTVVGFIGPEYLFDGKQILRAALEDHFCGKLLGLPMGVDICYTNHAAADQDDLDTMLVTLLAAGVHFIMGVPGGDDVMLHYQTTSFHDALFAREVLGYRPAPEFEQWMETAGSFQAMEHVPERLLADAMNANA